MIKLLAWFLLASTLFGVDPETVIMIDPAQRIVQNAVHVLTGQFFLSETDATAPGFEPIEIQRMYVADNELSWEGGWALFPHDRFKLYLTQYGIEAAIQEPHGEIVLYRLEADAKTMLPSIQTPPLPLGREISGRTNPKNNRLFFDKDEKAKDSAFRRATLRLGNGGTRIYEFKKRLSTVEYLFLLAEEIKPNGNRLVYKHDKEGSLIRISSHNPSKTRTYASIQLDYYGPASKTRDCLITYGDHQTLRYQFWRPQEKHLHKYFYLTSVAGSEAIERLFVYDPGYKKKEGNKRYNKEKGPLIQEVRAGRESTCRTTYYVPGNNALSLWGRNIFLKNARDHQCGKVKDLWEPVGPNGQFLSTYSFLYEHPESLGGGTTKIRDIFGNETHYGFGPNFQLSQIDFFSVQGLVRTERFFWNGLDLVLHAIYDPQQKGSQARQFEYDRFSNVIRETVFGNLTGTCIVPLDIHHLDNGIESYSIRYTYSQDGFNLPLSKEEENGKIVRYTYRTGTDRLTSKTLYDKDQILLRSLYRYDDDLFLVESIEENYRGAEVAERKITRYTPDPHNFPETISEYDGNGTLLQSKKLCYNASHQVVEEKRGELPFVKNIYQGSLLTAQTDPLGQTTTFTYDSRHRLRQRQKGQGLLETFQYDAAGRLVKKSESFGGETCTWTYEYDALHHKISEEGPDRAKTHFVRDRFGHVLKEIWPTAPDEEGRDIARTTEKVVDFLGRVIARKDPNGDSLTASYNAYAKPTRMDHPDGHAEHFIYSTSGTLTTHIDVEGNQTDYTYDVLGRMKSKEIYAPHKALLSSVYYTYDGLHLLTATDPLGVVTTYTYNAAGQKVKEKRNDIEKEYSYDFLGRLDKTIQEGLVSKTQWDAIGRVLEERKEDKTGNLLQQTIFVYRDKDREVEEITFPGGVRAVWLRRYDGWGRLQTVVDPLGHETKYQYRVSERTVTTIDPQGGREVETYSPLGALAASIRLDTAGNVVAREEYFYDRNQNLSNQRSTIFAGTTPLKQVHTRWVYGPMNRLQEFSRAVGSPSERSTHYTYSPKGYLLQTKKPSGQVLTYTYDRLGHLIELESADGSIHYAYHPNVLGWVLSATDLNAGLTTDRTCDDRGNCLQERLSNGFTVLRQYDAFNHCRSLQLPGAVSVTKEYNPLYLQTVACGLWVHHYTRYDLSGNLLEEVLPFQAGTVTYTVDPLQRTVQTQAPSYFQTIASFGGGGKVESVYTQMNEVSERSTFAYDPLGQLTQENEHSYSFDSHYNRLSHNQQTYAFDDLDQMSDWEYDWDGNPIANGGSRFQYDALDRLVAMEHPKQPLIHYTYDPFHRRLSKTVGEKTTRYLFDEMNEIGLEDNKAFSYRILGDTSKAEIGATVAIYLNGEFQVPIHDLQGNIVALLDPQTRQLAEMYRMSAFGQSSDSSQNAWRYLSKQMDEESGLVYFGRRYYDPKRGRWLTLDPQPDPDVLNLYAFALNDPFSWVDCYGLKDEPSYLAPPRMPSKSSLATFSVGDVEKSGSVLPSLDPPGVVRDFFVKKSDKKRKIGQGPLSWYTSRIN